jgi:hypothetical protein
MFSNSKQYFCYKNPVCLRAKWMSVSQRTAKACGQGTLPYCTVAAGTCVFEREIGDRHAQYGRASPLLFNCDVHFTLTQSDFEVTILVLMEHLFRMLSCNAMPHATM